MKSLILGIVLLVWMLLTFILGISLIGLLLFIVTNTWMEIGKSLMEALKEQ